MRPKLSQVSRRVLCKNDERPARGDRVGEEVVGFAIDSIVGGDGVKVGVSAHQING